MKVDLGILGFGVLVAMTVGFALLAQLASGARRPWMWLVAGAAWFVGGLVFSEGVFAWATADDLQPLIDGLLLDEALLGGIVVGLPVTGMAWYVTRAAGRGAQSHRAAR